MLFIVRNAVNKETQQQQDQKQKSHASAFGIFFPFIFATIYICIHTSNTPHTSDKKNEANKTVEIEKEHRPNYELSSDVSEQIKFWGQ